MKKIGNGIGVILLIVFCTLTCVSHVANKFFQEDVANIVIHEVDLDAQIDTLFEGIESFVPSTEQGQFQNLKEELKQNEEVKSRIGTASQQMLDDIINDNKANQDMKAVLNEVIHSYDDEIKEVAGDILSQDQINTYIDEALNYVPVQEVYDIAVDSFKTSIPQPYMKILNVANILSQKSVWFTSIALMMVTIIVLIILNVRRMKWLLPIGIGTLISGLCLLFSGQIIPVLYQNMIQNLNSALTQISHSDFKLISYYGLGFTLVGTVLLIAHVVLKRRR